MSFSGSQFLQKKRVRENSRKTNVKIRHTRTYTSSSSPSSHTYTYHQILIALYTYHSIFTVIFIRGLSFLIFIFSFYFIFSCRNIIIIFFLRYYRRYIIYKNTYIILSNENQTMLWTLLDILWITLTLIVAVSCLDWFCFYFLHTGRIDMDIHSSQNFAHLEWTTQSDCSPVISTDERKCVLSEILPILCTQI